MSTYDFGVSKVGFAMASHFISSGAKVIIAGTNQQKLDECVEKLGRKEGD